MPALSSFMSLPRRSRAKSVKAPFESRRTDSPVSPTHPYASPGIYDIRHDERPSEGFLASKRTDSAQPVAVQMKLDVDLSADPTNWFPEHLFPSDRAASARHSQAAQTSLRKVEMLEEEQQHYDAEASFYDYYDDDSMTDDFVANLEALDASSFINTNGENAQRPQPFQSSMAYRKTAPAPIKIPSSAFRGAKVQIIRSSGGPNSRTRPSSQVSTEEMSAVSGSTLARALMANSFVLSNDTASRHRSGASSPVQMDSATLPSGENPFLTSPMIRDRTLNWTGASEQIPPIPLNADKVYSPPVCAREQDKPKAAEKATSTAKRLSQESETSLAYLKPQNESIQSASPEPLHAIAEASPASNIGRFPNDVHTSSDASHSDSLASSVHQIVTPITATSSTSDRDIGGVLDYYESPGSPDRDLNHGAFKPPFSPIVEELSSQLSPPEPFMNRSRGNSVVLSSNTSSGIGRIEWMTRRESATYSLSPGDRRASKVSSLLPIGGRPRSAPHSPDASTASMYSTSSAAGSPADGSFAPPVRSGAFNRARSGSAPSPIRVVRDSNFPSYDIMVNPLSSPSNSSTSADGSDYDQQTFPQTPELFSPTFSQDWEHDNGSHTPEDLPQTPNSAFPFRNSEMPSLAQQVMLSRAGSGARHSRTGSLSRRSRISTSPVALSAIPAHHGSHDSAGRPTQPPLSPIEDTDETPAPTVDASNASLRSHHTFGPSTTISEAPLSRAATPSEQQDLPHLPTSPTTPAGSMTAPRPSTLNISMEDDRAARRPVSPHSPTVVVPYSDTPLVVPPPPPLPPPLPPTEPEVPQIPLRVPPPPSGPAPVPTREQPEAEPPSRRPYPTDPIGNDRASSYSVSMGSPPPYYTVVYDNPETATPSTGSSGQDHDVSQYGHEQDARYGPRHSVSSTFSGTESSARRRTTRAPIGPRGPTQHRDRDRLSISSVPSAIPSSTRRTFSNALPSPRFVTPTPKWRGYTLDAAKWTFTSAQLQDIVSHAIRQSAESSSIRLLRQHTADVEVPGELDRLDRRRTDVKTRYKLLTRRRGELLDALSAVVSENAGLAIRLVEELKDVSVSLDGLAEELHSLDEQISQLNTLSQVHSSSALAMALRKLNASFLKEYAQARALREQLHELETERDEAWKHAEEAARDLDMLSGEITRPSSPDDTANKRSSRISAVRRSSVRASKAGLRSSRSSMISNHRLSTSTYSGAKSAFSIDDIIPPVPPMPHRPKNINTSGEVPTRRSTAGLSSDGYTPNSETRAMVRAHEELCEMLGITMADTRPRRPRSLIIRSSDEDVLNPRPSFEPAPTSTRRSSSDRPNSLPDGSRLSEAYNAMIVDRQAILTTLEMLSD